MDLIINSHKVKANAYDADFMERFEPGLFGIVEKAKGFKQRDYKTVAEAYRAYNRMVEESIDEMLGDGTAAEVFEGARGDVLVHTKAIEDLSGWFVAEQNALNNITNSTNQKAANRAQRRAYEKKHRNDAPLKVEEPPVIRLQKGYPDDGLDKPIWWDELRAKQKALLDSYGVAYEDEDEDEDEA